MPVSSPGPLVLVRTVASRQVVTVASDEALVAGVRAGMSLAEANALCPGLSHAEHEPVRDVRGLVALARWLVRFTPAVMVDDSLATAGVARPVEPRYAIYLDLTGCERVFGGLGKLLRQLADALRRMRVRFSAAVAPTIGAAWALTFSADPRRRVFDEGDLGDALPPLPVGTLRLDGDAVAVLHHLGVETVGQLLRLPRRSLPARFGGDVLRRVDQAFGRAFEPLVPLEHHQPIEAGVDFDGIVQAPEALWHAFQQLIERVVVDLTRRGCGAKQVEATFVRPDLPPMRKTIHLSAPTRDGVTVFNLLRCALETLVPKPTRRKRGAPASVDTPFSRPRLQAASGCATESNDSLGRVAHLARREHTLGPEYLRSHDSDRVAQPGPMVCSPRANCTSRQFQNAARAEHFDAARKRDRLNGGAVPVRTREQFHPEGFTGLHLRVTHFERVSDDQTSIGDQAAQSARRELSRLIERLRARLGEAALAQAELAESHVPELGYRVSGAGERTKASVDARRTNPEPRPLHLLPTPVEVRVMVSPSHDRDGRPVSFAHEGEVHAVDHAIGPERISGQWWSGRHKTRDYFDATDQHTGRRFWLFRVVETGRWFLHGVFG